MFSGDRVFLVEELVVEGFVAVEVVLRLVLPGREFGDERGREVLGGFRVVVAQGVQELLRGY